jgi:hypothetical protein
MRSVLAAAAIVVLQWAGEMTWLSHGQEKFQTRLDGQPMSDVGIASSGRVRMTILPLSQFPQNKHAQAQVSSAPAP